MLKYILFGVIVISLLLGGGLFIMKNDRFDTSEKPPVMLTRTIDDGNLVNGNWEYMSGVKKTEDGLIISPTYISIVEQDGAFVTANSPINLSGTHIDNHNGDFQIVFEINPLKSSVQYIQLYETLPIIADEFRVESKSMLLEITSGQLGVSIWDGTGQKSKVSRQFSFAQNNQNILMIRKTGTLFSFIMNNQSVGEFEHSLFKNGKIWFGFDAKDESWMLSQLKFEAINNGIFNLGQGITDIVSGKEKGLQEVASNKRKDFTVGIAVALGPLVSDEKYGMIIANNQMFGGITPENQMKMINLQPQQGIYTFEQADSLVKFAVDNDLKVHGHTLVFGEANPPWFNKLAVKSDEDKEMIGKIMDDYIKNVLSHFGNNVSSWDVVNEPLADYDEFERGQLLRNHKWYQAMGENYIIRALTTAHYANPDAMLFINEYGLEQDGERWNAFITLLNRIKPELEKNGVPIEKVGIGFQAHVYERADRINPGVLGKHIKQLETLGFKMQISEMDVYSGDGDTIQAEQYAQVFQTCLSEKNCIAWRGWVLSDKYDYWMDNGVIRKGRDGLFDDQLKPRPSFIKIMSLDD